ncbi:DUF1190 domain-containing protein [Kiloniella laminariae]|uniref:DUF1190 domain-containing protein n=1 Tax=Kiloniella laminariae TaxID=454162 RepID=A0ABT4LFQ0_9PROT|nr:DUF1190 domain-containing protein [Kiloniella laminariae]MCZ4279938.1 DUF1190 domain-containing protein [Kiloniella laminariae]
MKRSRSLKLAFMGASALALTACDQPQDIAIFESVEQCSQQDGFDSDSCQRNMDLAREEHISVAPKYSAIEDCEADFGAASCEVAPVQTQSGGSVFMPLMMGYMMGNMLSGNSRVATQPLYRSKDDPSNFRTADNQKVAGKTGLSTVPGKVAKAPTVKTSTLSRGGFGASAPSLRSFGG